MSGLACCSPLTCSPSTIPFQVVFQAIMPIGGRMCVRDRQDDLVAHILARIDPLFAKLDLPEYAMCFRAKSITDTARSLARLLSVWNFTFGIDDERIHSHLALFSGELQDNTMCIKYPQLENIVCVLEIYHKSMAKNVIDNSPEEMKTANISPEDLKAADEVFWKEIQPLTERKISTEHACLIVLFSHFPEADCTRLGLSVLSMIHFNFIYHDLSWVFAKHGFWDLAFKAAHRFITDDGNDTLIHLCKLALAKNDLELAWNFHDQIAIPWRKRQALKHILEYKIEMAESPEAALREITPYFLKQLNGRVWAANRQDCLIAIAKKAVDAGNRKIVLDMIQEIKTCDSTWGTEGPYDIIFDYCVKARSYVLARDCAHASFECSSKGLDSDRGLILIKRLGKIVSAQRADGIMDEDLVSKTLALETIEKGVLKQICSEVFNG